MDTRYTYNDYVQYGNEMKLLPLLFLFLLGDARAVPVVIEPYVCQSVDKFYQIEEFFKYSEYTEVRYIILAVAIVESDWLNNQRHIDFNNYFSVKDFQHSVCKKNVKSIYCLKQFESLEENLQYMLWYFSSKGYPVDEKGFMLKLEGYAEDELHTKKVKRCVVEHLRQHGYTVLQCADGDY